MIPLAPVRSLNLLMRAVRPIILGGTEQLHIGLFPVRTNSLGADMPAGDLGIGILHIACRPAGHLRHIVGQAAIRDVAGDGTGDLGWAAGH